MYILKPKVIANITENNTVQKEVWVAVGKFISIHWKNQKSNYLCAMIYMANILCTFFFALTEDHCNSFDIKKTFIHSKPCWRIQNQAERI